MDASKTKQVRFSENSQMFIVDDLRCNQQSNIMWYSADEFVSLKAWKIHSILEARAQLSRGRTGPRNKIHVRAEILGLEKHLSGGIEREFRRRKREVFLAVKMEQRWQRAFLCCPNVDQLATVSRLHSRWAMRRAQLAAHLLQQDLMSTPDDDNANTVANNLHPPAQRAQHLAQAISSEVSCIR